MTTQAKHHHRIDHDRHHEPKGDLQRLFAHISENPVLYAAGAAFLMVCALLGIFYRVRAERAEERAATEYARAMKEKDDTIRVESLKTIAEGKSSFAIEALYMEGESAYRASDFLSAKAAFEKLRAEHPEYEHTPDAVEGLGYIEESESRHAEAVARYQEVLGKWPDTFVGRRQSLNIGRAQEKAGKLNEAIAAYRAQLEQFPGSRVAQHAQDALDKLRSSNPDLFPEEALPAVTPIGPVVAGEPSAAEATTLGPVEAVPAPSESAPAPAEAVAPTEGAAPAPQAESPAPVEAAPGQSAPAPETPPNP